MLGLSDRSMIMMLFTETGLWPIRYRRIIIAITYLQYLLQLPPNHYAHAALEECVFLDAVGKPSWLTDLCIVMLCLPGSSISLPGNVMGMTSLDCQMVIDCVKKACVAECRAFVAGSVKAVLIQERVLKDDDNAVLSMRKYLIDVAVPKY